MIAVVVVVTAVLVGRYTMVEAAAVVVVAASHQCFPHRRSGIKTVCLTARNGESVVIRGSQ